MKLKEETVIAIRILILLPLLAVVIHMLGIYFNKIEAEAAANVEVPHIQQSK